MVKHLSSSIARRYADIGGDRRFSQMHRRISHHNTKGVLLAVVLCLLALGLPGVARAETSAYGELARFGEGAAGGELGKLNDQELISPGFFSDELRFHLIGVESSTNDVYVLDEPENFHQEKKPEPGCEPAEEEPAPEECEKGVGPIVRHFRLQKFSPDANSEYHAVASVEFEEKCNPGLEDAAGLNVEGIAVDPHRKRVYVLVNDLRQKTLAIDHSGNEGDLPAASTLFAFSTEPNAKEELPPAGKEVEETVNKNKVKVITPILTGPGESELAAQSIGPGKALLEPHGITVDPATGDIIIIAHEDGAGEEEDDINNPGDHYVLQRILPTGALVPGAEGRYIDKSSFFKVGRFTRSTPPNSPVVVGPEQSEQVDVEYESGIVRVPYAFASTSPPEYVYQPPEETPRGVFEGFIAYAPLGGGLSASPSGPEGNILYAQTEVENEQPKVGGGAQGLITVSSTTGSVLGWTGGQSLSAPRRTEPPEPSYSCVISPNDGENPLPISAGSEGKVFVLAAGFLEGGLHESGYTGPAYPAVVELGPEGVGCPEASAEPITTEVNGELLNGRSVSMSQSVTFSSFVLQADALKVEWNFGDGTSETVTEGFHCPKSVPEQYSENIQQCPIVHHTFVRAGAIEVTEKVYTDDLSTPALTRTTTVSVSGGARPPTAVANGPVEVAKGQEALFDGSASWDPSGPNQITKYYWVFGDGQEESTTSPTTVHRYASVGSYTVSLSVTDAHGLMSMPNMLPNPVMVVEPQVKGEEILIPPQSGTGGSPAGQATATAVPPSSLPKSPDVTISSTSLIASAKGLLPITLSCAGGGTGCSGTVTLRALVSGAARHGKSPRATEVTLAGGTFTVASGSHKRIVVHLSAQALELLARSHSLHAQLTILARDVAGATRTTRVPVLVRAAAGAAAKAHKH
jgi:PKD repeat protein